MKRKRFAIAFILLLGIVTSPVILFSNPMRAQAYPSVTDTSSSHATLPMSENSSSPSKSTLGTPSTQAALQIPRSFQSTDIVNSNGIYEITFITATSGDIKTIEITFPAGTNIAAAGFIERVGIGPGFFSKAGTTLTYNVQSAVNVPAGTFIRFELVNVKNPPNPSSSLQVTITTKDNMGNVIDGPTPTSAYTIRQIDTGDIADNAVTTPKIADDAVTGSKIAGTDKLIFGVCFVNLPILQKRSAMEFNCSDPDARIGDDVIAERGGPSSCCPAPEISDSHTSRNFDGVLTFKFQNQAEVQSIPQNNVKISYIIFKATS